MKRKIFIAVMMIVLTITLFAACGEKEGGQDNGGGDNTVTTAKNYSQIPAFLQAELLKAALQ